MARIRIIFEKKGWIIFINHMDLPVLFSRAARRAGLSQEFTQGFSPHPHISLCSPLAIGVEGRAEPAEFWFNEWHGESAVYWNAKLPEGLKILQYAEVEGPALAKLATAAVYIIAGTGFDLSCDAKAVLEKESKRTGILYSSSLDEGIVTLTVGGLENCGAGNFVRALKDSGICGGWSDLSIVRETVGTWDTETSRTLSLI